jgi:hypothetical protein
MERKDMVMETIQGRVETGLLTPLFEAWLQYQSDTALGSFLTHNTGLVSTGTGVYFVVALALGYWFLFDPKRPKRDVDAACPTYAPVAAETRVQERSPMPGDLAAPRR